MRLSPKTPGLSTALAVSLLAIGASAQQPGRSTVTQTNGRTSAATNTGRTSAATNTATKVSLTTGTTGTTGTSAATVPKLSSSTTSAATGLPSLPTNLPTLTGVATIVTPVVPNTKQAPFMQQSTMPDGTVFIVVGAILGFMAMSVLLWRGLVAWTLHRSVKRAALGQHPALNDTKTPFRIPGLPTAPFYKYTDRESTISFGALGHKGGKKGNRRTSTAGVGAGASAGNLFFSPTAGAATAASGANRGSNYLPSGYYAAGAAQAGAGQSHVTLGHQPAISLSSLQQTQGYPRASKMGETPPDSPAYGAERSMQSSSTLNSNQGHGSQERAPSAYLEGLFDGENGPPVPGHGKHQRGNSGGMRY